MKYVIILIFYIVFFVSNAAIYQWKDKNGVTVFSDVPHIGAKELKLSSTQTFHEQAPTPKKKESVSNKRPLKKESPLKYTLLTIHAPLNEATVRNNNAVPITIVVEVQPSLQKGDKAELLVDNHVVSVLEVTKSKLNFTLKGVDRGEHKLSVRIVRDGKTVISSKTITVYFQQNSILFGKTNLIPKKDN